MHLYLHIPFCHRICPYCAFYKHRPGRLANEAFVDALLAEARLRTRELADEQRAPETVYFGGGTPSLLNRKLLERLCRGLGEIFDLDAVSEWTLEANPSTFDLAKARTFLDCGIDRVSLGVQSFDPATLATLGRDHSPGEAAEAFHCLREAGCDNVSIDLMFSVPGQDGESWRRDLETAATLEPEHLSAYNLTYEEDTEFLERHRRGELDADEGRDASLFHEAMDFLESAGYRHYEISNYARPGCESRHNRAYWNGADYLGLGPGAVSTLADRRWKTLPDTAAYVAAMQSSKEVRTERETLSAADQRLERIALLLRTREGIPASLVERPASDEKDGKDDHGTPVATLIEEGFVEEADGRLRLTREGKALADPIAGMLA